MICATTDAQTPPSSVSRQLSSNDCAPSGSGESSVDLPPHDGFKAPPVCQEFSSAQECLPEGKKSIDTGNDHSKEEVNSDSGNIKAHVRNLSSGDVSSSQQDKTLSQKKNCEDAGSPTADNSSPSETSGAGGSSVAVEQQQQAHDGSNRSAADGQQTKEQENMFGDNPAVGMKPRVSFT